jgi:hypothetical protein
MNNIGRGLEADSAAFAEKADLAPFSGSLNAGQPRFVVSRTINGFFNTVAIGESANLGNIFGARRECRV